MKRAWELKNGDAELESTYTGLALSNRVMKDRLADADPVELVAPWN